MTRGLAPARGRVLAILVLVYISSYLDRQLLAILLPLIKRDLALSDTALGLLTGPAFAALYILGGFPIARLADRTSRRAILAVSIGVWSVMTMLTGWARNLGEMAVCRIGVGIGEAGCSPPAHSLIADLFPPERRATALAIYSMGISAGVVIAFALGGWLGETLGWRRAFMLVGAPGLLLVALVLLGISEPARTRPAVAAPSLRAAWADLLARPAFRQIALAGSVTNLAFIGGIQWMPSFLTRVHGLPLSEIGLWLAGASGVAGGCGTFLGGWLSDRLGRRDRRWYVWLPAIGMAVSSPALIAVFLVPDGRVATLLFIIPSFCAALGVAPIYAMAQGLARRDTRAVAAATILFAINLLGLGVGPYLIGLLSDALAPSLGAGAALGRALAIVLGVGSAWPILHFLLAARTLRVDLERAAA